MNSTTMVNLTRATWFRRGLAGVATLAMVGTLSAGLMSVRQPEAGLALTRGATDGVAAPAAPAVTERYRKMKEQQIAVRLDPAPYRYSAGISDQFRAFKESQVQQKLDQEVMAAPKGFAASTGVGEHFRMFKERQAQQGADRATVLERRAVSVAGVSVSEQFRHLKEQQAERRATVGEPDGQAHPSQVSGRFQDLKERQIGQRIDD